MASAKSVFKGLAIGSILGALGAMVLQTKDKEKKLKKLVHSTEEIAGRVMDKAKQLGSVTKSAYGKVVDAIIDEYKGAKTLSESELKELKNELKDSWAHVESILKAKKPEKKAAKK